MGNNPHGGNDSPNGNGGQGNGHDGGPGGGHGGGGGPSNNPNHPLQQNPPSPPATGQPANGQPVSNPSTPPTDSPSATSIPSPIAASTAPPPDPQSPSSLPSVTPETSPLTTPTDTSAPSSQNPGSEASSPVVDAASQPGLASSLNGPKSSDAGSSALNTVVPFSPPPSESSILPTPVSTSVQSRISIASTPIPQTNQNSRIIAAIMVPVILFLAALGLGAGCFIRRRRRRAAARMSLRSFDSRSEEAMRFSSRARDSYSASMASGRGISTDLISRFPLTPEPLIPSYPVQDSLPHAFHYYPTFDYTSSQMLSAPDLDLQDTLSTQHMASSPAPSSLATESSHVPFSHRFRDILHQDGVHNPPTTFPPDAPRNNDSVEDSGETQTATAELTVAASGPDGYIYPRGSYVSDDVKTVYAI